MLSELDKSILNIIQTKFPIVSRPFASIAEVVGSDEQTVFERVIWLKETGYIRRLGAFFNSDNLGYRGTLVALEVVPEWVSSVAQAVNCYQGVTHNYQREGQLNLWFTLLSPDSKSEQRVLAEVEKLAGVKRVLNLPAIEKYKVNVEFKLK